jgi:hypothetical protein
MFYSALCDFVTLARRRVVFRIGFKDTTVDDGERAFKGVKIIGENETNSSNSIFFLVEINPKPLNIKP